MPAASPGDRLRMEEALGPELVAAIHAQCRAFPVPPDRWHRVPLIARGWEVVAASLLAERIGRESEVGAKTAMFKAAVRLGLQEETITSRLKRGHADAYRPPESGVHSAPHPGTDLGVYSIQGTK